MERHYRWKSKQIREHIEILQGKLSPTTILKNACYLHGSLKKWVQGNIWIYQDRIVYCGEAMPLMSEKSEVIECKDYFLVPGYIEPHVHPFQLYNPHSFANYASLSGTTTIINDNLMLSLLLGKKKAFSLLEELKQSPVSMYWWSRFDSQTELLEEEKVFSNEEVKGWLEHPDVLQGGELTAWPKLMAGDDMLLHWMQETKKLGKKMESHLPGASDATLAKMKLFGADGDHEAMTGEDVYKRLLHGYQVTLRHSSIRPDLPKLLKEILELDITSYDSFMLTSDGSTPSFYEQGVLDWLLKMTIDAGIPEIEAYQMVTYNVAKYYGIDHLHGMISTGKIANINFLESPSNPTPIAVMGKGKWIKHLNGETYKVPVPKWKEYLPPLTLPWDLTDEELQFSMPFGIEMVNDVITKPYTVSIDCAFESLSTDHDESFLLLLDRHGKWRISTLIKGFSHSVSGFASSFSNTGDIIVIGKSKNDMKKAFARMKAIGGGMVLVENGELVHEIPLILSGIMYDGEMSELIELESTLKEELSRRGYAFADPVYTLLFLSSTHLPYIRVTQKGLYDVMKKSVLFPSIMR
ncbi:adenine deaminase C-terminal domain-containing protein [Bacillus sp. 2205SS5-2]|uniref:adenine deaminase C-terminal domain-containing protein n=1 Tax=Bacillus sp. 2205SS5-2 TaxID=3109031 RepID=UPI003007CCDD